MTATLETSDEASYLPPNSAHFYTLQVLKGDRRPVAEYEGDEHVPYCLQRKITREDCGRLLQEGLATFTVRVPLAVVIQGPDAIVEHVQATAFDFTVSLSHCEFRPVGAVISEFRKEFDGDVLLQLTCSITDEG